jgi:8-oxo-dGTP pyrophosphatase MutT (NUDIX family)
MSILPWPQKMRELLVDMKIFELHRVIATSPRTGQDRTFALVRAGNWVNVVAINASREMVLVRQYRHGTGHITLEIPGGVIDDGEDPQHAAVRELLEETGYSGGTVSSLGVVDPNPAFIDNHCYTFLVEGCRKTADLDLDDGEDIEVITVPLAKIPKMVATGDIDHALVLCAFWWLAAQRPDLLKPSS